MGLQQCNLLVFAARIVPFPSFSARCTILLKGKVLKVSVAASSLCAVTSEAEFFASPLPLDMAYSLRCQTTYLAVGSYLPLLKTR